MYTKYTARDFFKTQMTSISCNAPIMTESTDEILKICHKDLLMTGFVNNVYSC